MKTTQLFGKVSLCALFFYIFSLQNFSHTQVIRCATVEMEAARHAQNPDVQTEEAFEAELQKIINEKKNLAETQLIIGGVYQIPVVVHVIHNGEAVGTGTNVSFAAIQSQIDVLNEDFRRIAGTNGFNTHPDGADTQIEFCLAMRRPDGSAFPVGEPGVNRINRTTAGFTAPPYATNYINSTIKTYTYNNGNPTATRGWVPDKYMNMWLCNISDGVLGYAQFPTSPIGGMGCGAQNDATDGVVMLYNSIGKSSVTGFGGVYNEGRTATHEIGHWLGLRHIWGDGGCGVDDFCLDTPLSDAPNYGCPTTNSCTDPAPDPNDMVQNYMDYTNDLCMNVFTNDQKMRMRTVLENSPIRVSLINSDACVPPSPNDASIVNIINPKGDNCAGSIIPTVVLRNRGSNNLTSATISFTIDNGTATTFNWTGSITPGNQANVVLPAFTAPLGVHTFNATSLLPNGVADPNTTYDASEITFAVSNGYQPNYSQNFDGGVFPPDVRWNVVNPNSDCYEWIGGVGMSSSGVSNNACAMMPFYQNGTTQDEYLYTPIYILPCNASAASLIFDVAYKRRITGVNDRLRVEISTDCGATWNATPIFDKSGATLQTNGTQDGYFIPSTTADWRNEVVNLLSFVGANSQSVQFRFRGTCAGNGGNLYIDNLQFTATTPAEANVQVTGTNVLDAGFYNAGSFTIGSPATITFTVQNTGSSNLTLTGPISITGATQFVLNTSFGSTTVAPGASTTFLVNFTPTGAGPFTANVSFGTNDCDEGTYNFQLTGGGTVTPPVAAFTGTPTTICQGSSVTFTDASAGATSWSWTFTGGTPSSATGSGPHVITYATAGNYNVSLTATNAYGSNVSTMNNYVTVNGGVVATLPLVQGFTAATFPPTNWSINNGGSGVTWVRSTTQGTAPSAGNSAVINNFSTNFSGAFDDLNTVPVNLSSFTSAQLTFDVAYARYNTTNIDQLDVLVSTDCGETYNVVYSKSGLTLATDGTQTAAYTTPTTWRNEIIDLTPYVGNSAVRVKFRNISGYGQYLYLDNINMTGVVATATADFTATPNPACVNSNVTFTDASTNATSWSWNFGTGASPATATGVGPHTVTYSSSGTKNISLTINGGASVSNQSIVVNAVPSAPVVVVSNGCGSSTLSTTGSNLLWSTGATTPSINVASAGTYTVTQTVVGCTSANGSGVASPTAVPSAPVVVVSNGCGSSTLTTSGSNLLWSTGATTPSINVTSAGTYTVTQTVGGCTSASGSGVASPTAVPSAPVVVVSNGCGSSTLTTSGSNLLWSTGATTPLINVTSAGTYTVTQTVGGCTSANGSGVASLTAVPSAPVVVVSNGCGSSTLSTTGSNLLWSTGATTPSINVTSAGTYTVTQTVGGCTSANGSGVASPTAVPSAPVVVVSNGCGSSTLTTSGSNLLWSTGATTPSINVTSAGTYTVTQTVGGCISASGSGVASPTAVPSAPVVVVSNGCGSSTLTTSGSNLLWSTGATIPSINVTSAGTYTVTQTVGGCTSANGSGIASPTAVPSAPVVVVSNGCGSSTLSTTGSNLLWSTGATTPSINVTSAGTYTVTQTVGGCTSANGSGVASPTAVPSAPVVVVSNGCGSSTLTTSGSNLLWSTGATTPSINVTSAGTYTVTQTVGGCTSASGSGVASPTAVPSAPVVVVSNGCGSSTLTTSGSNLLWSTGATTPSINVTSAGTYTVTQTVGGCTGASGSGVASPTAVPSAPVVVVSNGCGSSTLTTSGSNLLWSTGATTPSINVTSAGTYTVTQTVGGCTGASGSGVASPTAVPSAPVVVVSNGCGSSTLTTSGSNLLWSTGATTPSINVASAGTYTVTQTVGGCTSASGSGVASPTAVPSAPVVVVSNGCGSSTLSTTGSNLLWSTGATTPSINVASAGTYTITQTIDGCEGEVGMAIASPLEVPGVTFTPLSDLCVTASAFELTGGSPAGGDYSGIGVIGNQFDPSISGAGSWPITYTFEATNGCSNSVIQVQFIDPCVSLNDLSKFEIGLSPNPTSGMIKLNASSIIRSVKVFDYTGRLIIESKDNTQNELSFDLSEYANGMYSFLVTIENDLITKRIVLHK